MLHSSPNEVHRSEMAFKLGTRLRKRDLHPSSHRPLWKLSMLLDCWREERLPLTRRFLACFWLWLETECLLTFSPYLVLSFLVLGVSDVGS
jgi:hypothetical protein